MSSFLKEEDALFELVRARISARLPAASAVADAFAEVEELVKEHHRSPEGSRLALLCPSVKSIFAELELGAALREYDASFRITERRFVPPSFREVREVFNLATTVAVAKRLRLVTLDADETIYSDGGCLDPASPMIGLIAKLLRLGISVALVTAASYPGQPEKYEVRLAGLLSALAFAIECGAPATLVDKFMVMGGQSSYLLKAVVRSAGDSLHVALEEMSPELWKKFRGVRWDHDEVRKMLDAAQACLIACSTRLNLDVQVIRKERAVGVIAPSGSPAAAARLSYEVLEELALEVQHRLAEIGTPVPHCAFNGGHDVFVDVGHKALGVNALQGLTGALPAETVHVGDRMTRTGNDERTRSVAHTLWVADPHETAYLLGLLIRELRREAAAEASLPPRPPPVTAGSPQPLRLRTDAASLLSAGAGPPSPLAQGELFSSVSGPRSPHELRAAARSAWAAVGGVVVGATGERQHATGT